MTKTIENNNTSVELKLKRKAKPRIYAFKSKVLGKEYTKVGFTTRDTGERLSEWDVKFTNPILIFEREATVCGQYYITDDAIFKYFALKGKHRLTKSEFQKQFPNLTFCDEIFEDITVEDINEAFNAIEESIKRGDKLYKTYNEKSLQVVACYDERIITLKPRPNQFIAIERFKEIMKKGHKSSLLCAATRYGKSYVGMECVLLMNAKIALITSAKAEVKDEWHKTVSTLTNFEGYVFLESKDLIGRPNIIKENIKKGNKVVIFLTLQDLSGDDIKNKHKEVFESKIDIIIVDETHHAARAEKYGKVLRHKGLTKEQIDIELEQIDVDKKEDIINYEDIQKLQKQLKAKHVMHVSATPFYILMSREFSEEQIITNVQYIDILEERNKWIEDNNKLENPEPDDKNPYYGLPDLTRFGFNISESTKQKLNQLKESGTTYSLTDLFLSQSITKDVDNKYKLFVHEQEVLDWLKSIDGTKNEDCIIPFLDNKGVMLADMCRHMVWTLPYRSSCDAMEELIKNNSHLFKHLSDYEIINIAGVDSKTSTKYPTMDDVREKIKQCEKENKKTITLTAIRGLTGVTVEEWDTLLYLKETSSIQDYEQAIGRLFTPYVTTFENNDGEKIKIVKKPQVLLVDFDVNRMFRLEEEKCRIYGYNVGNKGGNVDLKKQIQKHLQLMPIVTCNHNKIQISTPVDIMNVIRNYRLNRSIDDEINDIYIDENMISDKKFIEIIDMCKPIETKKSNTPLEPTEKNKDGGDNLDTQMRKKKIEEPEENYKGENDNDKSKQNPLNKNEKSEKDIKKERIEKWKTLFRHIMLFVYCSESKNIKNLSKVIEEITANDDNKKIAEHLNINVDDLKYLMENCTPHTIHSLDYAIENTKERILDESIKPIERAEIILKEFTKISESEIITPKSIAEDMTTMLVDNVNNIGNMKFLDIASKRGEFATYIYKKFINEYPEIVNNIYSLPTSHIGYMLTRKMYKLLGMPVENVISNFTTNDLIDKVDQKNIIKILKNMNFDVIIGNPPYHMKDDGNEASSKPLYHLFIQQAKELNPRYLTMIIPARWYAGGKGLDEFRNIMLKDKHIKVLHDFNNEKECFPTVDIKGGVCYFLWDKDYSGNCEVNTHSNNEIISSMSRPLLEEGCVSFIRHNDAISILRKVQSKKESSFSNIVSSRKPFGLATNFTDFEEEYFQNSIKIYANKSEKYVDKKHILKNIDWINSYKIIIPKAIGVGDITKDWLKPIIVGANTCCTETYLVVGPFKDEIETQNVYSYMQTKFFHLMLGLKKVTQDTTRKVYQFVPVQDFEKSWTDEELYAKYGLTEKEIAFIESTIEPDK